MATKMAAPGGGPGKAGADKGASLIHINSQKSIGTVWDCPLYAPQDKDKSPGWHLGIRAQVEIPAYRFCRSDFHLEFLVGEPAAAFQNRLQLLGFFQGVAGYQGGLEGGSWFGLVHKGLDVEAVRVPFVAMVAAGAPGVAGFVGGLPPADPAEDVFRIGVHSAPTRGQDR